MWEVCEGGGGVGVGWRGLCGLFASVVLMKGITRFYLGKGTGRVKKWPKIDNGSL